MGTMGTYPHNLDFSETGAHQTIGDREKGAIATSALKSLRIYQCFTFVAIKAKFLVLEL